MFIDRLKDRITKVPYAVWIGIALFVLIYPAYFSHIMTDKIWKIAWVIVVAAILFLYAWRRRISGIMILCTLMYGIIFVVTVFKGGNFVTLLRQGGTMVALVMLTELCEGCRDVFYRTVIVYATLLVLVNFISIIAFPGGLYYETHIMNGRLIQEHRFWFLGYKNGIGKYCFFDLILIALYNYRTASGSMGRPGAVAEVSRKRATRLRIFFNDNREWIFFYSVAGISLLSTVLIKSAMSMTVILLFTLGTLLVRPIEKYKPFVFDFRIFCGIAVAACLVIAVFRQWGFLEFFIEKIFHKNAGTFGGRKIIWENAIMRIGQSPLWGHGYITEDDFRVFLNYHNASDAHNYYFTLLINGGILSFACFAGVIAKCGYNIIKNKFKPAGIILSGALFLLLIMMIVENTKNGMVWIVLTLAYHMEQKEYCFKKLKITV